MHVASTIRLLACMQLLGMGRSKKEAYKPYMERVAAARHSLLSFKPEHRNR